MRVRDVQKGCVSIVLSVIVWCVWLVCVCVLRAGHNLRVRTVVRLASACCLLCCHGVMQRCWLMCSVFLFVVSSDRTSRYVSLDRIVSCRTHSSSLRSFIDRAPQLLPSHCLSCPFRESTTTHCDYMYAVLHYTTASFAGTATAPLTLRHCADLTACIVSLNARTTSYNLPTSPPYSKSHDRSDSPPNTHKTLSRNMDSRSIG